ncbi:hypothetical protein [Acidovorax sp. sic0104]|uniref:hypothetical protein n=1 Tax=Acidovorax sp. sic0104 TaxID=2854784 RepID=UPI001C494CA6|nr:hypothetical protein [Acidovorax sp. sic0104]MBV7541016.1 hypothetical protein [Acidovorax sp. sic0104]
MSKIKVLRFAALSGLQSYENGSYLLPQATGVLEITGHRAGTVRTELIIGFSNSLDLPPPTFTLDETTAAGTLSLPSILFAPFLQIAGQPNCHFRLSSDGTLNGLASDPAMFKQWR